MKRVLTLTIVIILTICIPVFAATFYISPSGNDSTGIGTYANPWKTFNFSFGQMNGGDTLILRDGNYTYSENGRITSPPNGSAGGYTVIKAENNWKAMFIGYSESNVPIELTAAAYI